jgi:hypothetical protein
LGRFLKVTEVTHILGLLFFHLTSYVFFFDKNGIFFSQAHLVTLILRQTSPIRQRWFHVPGKVMDHAGTMYVCTTYLRFFTSPKFRTTTCRTI